MSARPREEPTTRIRRPLELAILVVATVSILVAVVTAGRAEHPAAIFPENQASVRLYQARLAIT